MVPRTKQYPTKEPAQIDEGRPQTTQSKENTWLCNKKQESNESTSGK